MSTILIDVDGVVADFKNTLLDTLQLKDPAPNKWDFLNYFKGEDKERVEALLNSMKFWKDLELIDGAKKGVKALKDFGHTVIWVTAPWASFAEWDTARRFWIKEHFGDDKVIIRSDKEKVDGDVFIDDKPDNIEKWKKAHPNGKALLYEHSYNQDYLGALKFKWDRVSVLL